MTDIKSILKGINHADQSEQNIILINELKDITTDCLKKLQVIRKDLISAYIVSQYIIINDDDKYEFKPEKEVRAENKQHLDRVCHIFCVSCKATEKELLLKYN